jgi:hypothetical protein
MRPKLTLSLALTIVAVTLLPAGCGGREKPPEETAARSDVAAELNRDLDTAERRVGTEDCGKARETLERIDRRVRGLPPELEANIRSALEKRVETLGEVVADKCGQEGEKPRETERPNDNKPESAAAPERQTGGSVEQTAPNAGTSSSTGGPTTPRSSDTPRGSGTPRAPGPPATGPTPEEEICGKNPAPEC